MNFLFVAAEKIEKTGTEAKEKIEAGLAGDFHRLFGFSLDEGKQWLVKSGTNPRWLPSAATPPERGFLRVTNP